MRLVSMAEKPRPISICQQQPPPPGIKTAASPGSMDLMLAAVSGTIPRSFFTACMSKHSCFLNSSHFNSSQHMPWFFVGQVRHTTSPKDRLLSYETSIDETAKTRSDIAKCQDSHYGTTSARVRVVYSSLTSPLTSYIRDNREQP